MSDEVVVIPCPVCEAGELKAVVTAPYARGFIFAYQMGSKKIIGCKPCVGKGLRAEAGKSLLFGWFSITALFLNLLFIPWNMSRSFFVKEDDLAVSKFFDDVGVPKPGTEYRMTNALYAAAASQILADGKIEDTEVSVAIALGKQMVSDFDEKELYKLLEQKGGIQSLEDMSSIFKIYLTDDGKEMLIRYLLGISIADGDFDPQEDKLIEKLAKKMEFGVEGYRRIRSELLD